MRADLERYLAARFGPGVRAIEIEPLGGDAGAKGFGYGAPVRVRLAGPLPDDAPAGQIVIHTAGTRGFGHDTLADHAAGAILAFETFNNLPGHVRALDVGAVAADGRWISLEAARDFFLVTEYAEGEPYFHDLERAAPVPVPSDLDLRRAERLAGYLAAIHADRCDDPALYARRTRDLFGHHECIAGLLDSYDDCDLTGFTSAQALRDIEARCLAWRHRLKRFSHRLCRVHGDFHPWNVLWQEPERSNPGELALLDRSRGEWGEAADDVSCMAINYLFFAIRARGAFTGPMRQLWDLFFDRYLRQTGDEEILRVIPPYFVWRALVLASPLWYPAIDLGVRRSLFRFIDRLLEIDTFDWRGVDALLG
jgi:aminoglycoside phosphotransferase (APT) family kinase protein